MSRAAQRARVVLSRFHDPRFEAVDVEAFLERERVEVARWPLDETVAGVLVREPRAIIAVNTAHHRNRQRFTMAHEYYHYLYHQSLTKLMCMTSLSDSSRYEREANRFAAALLMPEETVRRLLSRYRAGTVASKLMVSEEALQWRMRALGCGGIQLHDRGPGQER